VKARAKATSTTVNPSDPASLEQFQASQTQLSGALSRLLVTMEAYPQLTASKSFQDLQSQLEGTENRIAVARGDYNTAATTWNASVQRVPTVFIARLFGFTVVALFDAMEGAEVAPKVDFTIE
jgi:LemA protein